MTQNPFHAPRALATVLDDDPRPTRVLVVDDEEMVLRVIARMAQSLGHEVVTADGYESAVERLAEEGFDVVLTDLMLGVRDGMDLLRHVHQDDPDLPVVLITGQATIDSAMAAIRAGAYDYLAKPVRPDVLSALLHRAIEKKRMVDQVRLLQREMRGRYDLEHIAGRSPQMLEVFKTVARVAHGRTGVLILGESGTGKELVARQIHGQSPRAARRFVPVNVSAIPEGLLESELFGHVKGAFTGAISHRVGLFDEAHEGTLFLDEIGDLSPPLQAKLLRVLQEQRIKPVGGNDEHSVDVRLVAATHRDLEAMTRDGRFREGLYYRLNVIQVSLPPLRERREDIPVLIEHFLHKYEHETGGHAPRVSVEAMERLIGYDWPGNVRELENVMERAMLLSSHGLVTPEALPARMLTPPSIEVAAPAAAPPEPRADMVTPSAPVVVSASSVPTLDEVVERHVAHVLALTRGNRTRAARLLGISRRTLHRMAERERAKGEGPAAE